MAIIDNDGRLFGRINVIDAALVLLIVLAVPVSFAAYRVFGVRRPTIARIEPATLSVDGDRRLRLEGTHFRPYLKVFFFPTGAPTSLADPQAPDSGKNQATFLLETSERSELTLPSTPPGTYDLYLYDEGREVAHRNAAFTIVPRGEQARSGAPVAAVAAVPIELTVRFRIDPAIVHLVKTGDVGLPDATAPGRPPVLASLRTPAPAPELPLQFAGGRVAVSTSGRELVAEGVVQLGALRTNGVWHTAATPRIRAGESIAFETATYTIKGMIIRLTVVPPGTADREGRQ